MSLKQEQLIEAVRKSEEELRQMALQLSFDLMQQKGDDTWQGTNIQ
jgi:hypothetical protein